MLLIRVILMALVVGALAHPAAASAATVPIDVVPVSPANGGAYRASNASSILFTVRWTPPPSFEGSLFLEITNQNIADQDGTLANDQQYGAGAGSPLEQRDADPSIWTGTASGDFLSKPGTYYFQLSTFGGGADCGPMRGFCTLASPVFSFNIQAGSPTGAFVWKLSDASSAVRRVIKTGTRRSPSNLHRSCSRMSSLRVRCRADWYDSRWIWAGTLRLTIDSSATKIAYGFNGQRASRACVRS